MGKIVTKEEYLELKDNFSDKKIILCHGVYDLVHPGHIIHFEEAKELGDILVVSVTAAKYVRKGLGRPYFNDELRLKVLAAIEYIDYVILSESYTADDIIELVEPTLYVKGKEYEKEEDDITGKIQEEVELVKKHGGNVFYTSGLVFSSTKLINNMFPALSPEVKNFIANSREKINLDNIKEYVKKIEDLKVLVIGDVIIDEYVFCNMQGLMSKDKGYSVRYENSEEYLGGALAIARHISSFCDNVTIMSIVGNEENIHSRILNELSNKMRINMEYSEEFNTIIKKRFISQNEKREEIDKIFVINNLASPMKIDNKSMEKFKTKLKEKIKDYDVVILCDFGHGLVDKEVMALIEEKAKFIALNCQTNSSNYGMNLITKYKRADVFTLDQKELKLAFSDYEQTEEDAFIRLANHFSGKGLLTRGSKGAMSIENEKIVSCPAFTLKVKDTIGAGDAFFSVSSLFVAAGASMDISLFMGNIAGALATNIVGNKEAIEKVNVLKYASTLLNI